MNWETRGSYCGFKVVYLAMWHGDSEASKLSKKTHGTLFQSMLEKEINSAYPVPQDLRNIAAIIGITANEVSLSVETLFGTIYGTSMDSAFPVTTIKAAIWPPTPYSLKENTAVEYYRNSINFGSNRKNGRDRKSKR